MLVCINRQKEVESQGEEKGEAVKCEAIGCASDQDRQCRGLCFVCFTKRRFAGEEEEAKWDREHREPKEIVIEVEVPGPWIRCLGNAGFTDRETEFTFLDPLGRLVLRAKKETP